MEIVETSVFTRQVLALLADDEYRTIQAALANRPTLGPVIPGSGGVRKVRWGLSGRGKGGGVRVIYYWAATKDVLLMLLIYAKSEQENLSPSQLKALRGIVKDEYR